MLCDIHHRLALHVFGGWNEGGALGLCQPHFEEMVVESAPAAGVRLDGGLVLVNDRILRYHLGWGAWLFANATLRAALRRY